MARSLLGAVRRRVARQALVTGVAATLVAVVAIGGCKKADVAPLDSALAAARKAPESAEAQLALGKAYYEKKQYNDAFAAFAKAHKLAPNEAEPAFQLALVDFELRDSDHGLTMARAALAADPKHAAAHEILGRHLLYVRKPDEALRAFQEALRLDPKLTVARLNTVATYTILNRPEDAAAAAEEAVQLDPKDAGARFCYGDLLESTGDKAGAEAQFREAIKLDAKHRDSLLRLAIMLVEGGRNYSVARTFAQRADEISPGDGMAAIVAARALFLEGSRIDALREMQSCAQANPYNPKVLLWFGRSLREDGKEQIGLQVLAAAAQVSPMIPLTKEERARLEAEADKARKEGKGAIDAQKVFGKQAPAQTVPKQGGASDKAPAAAGE